MKNRTINKKEGRSTVDSFVLSPDEVMLLRERVPSSWSFGSDAAPAVKKLLLVFSVSELRALFITFEDPTGTIFIDKILHGDHEFFDTILSSTLLGSRFDVWIEHTTERLVSKGVTGMTEIMNDADLPPSIRLSAAKGLAAFNKNYSRQERKTSINMDLSKRANAKKNKEKAPSDACDVDIDFDRIIGAGVTKGPVTTQ
jgi:hypothetical protein